MNEEIRWFQRLKRCLADMPDSLEIQVHQNYIQMNKNGAREKSFKINGHADEVEEIEGFITNRVYACSESA